ncbi:low-density lipoprotein receptor-related protein 3/10/12 [Mytilus galloprovincialis]|uniref:Low-density lipoprotein receptor-related protein 3/10/12 n=1 Tax=Mytilus galloprovincialis TaxID=29158 RepID=A0A8B6DE28_MYTGA|nr:low-density lipoprotein receptor-related protein 3/10/12 [Mytilus galloprovincialis]
MKFVFVLAICIVCAAAVTVLKVKNTRQCKAKGGMCKQTCAVDEEDTGSCCRNSNRCCQPPTCIDTLQYAQCKAKNGDIKPVCDVNEQDTGIGPFCNTNRCCEPPTCIAQVDCNCENYRICPSDEYEDSTGNCSGSDECCKPCCLTCGGIFNGPVGSFTSPNYPSKYCNNQNCYYNITVAEGSKVMLNFTYYYLEDGINSAGLPFDFVQIYDGEVKAEALIDTFYGGPTEGKEFNSTSNKMIIHFVTDNGDTFPGFSVSYKTLQ